MGRYRKYFKIYRKMQEMNIKSLMYYRADFLMMTFFTLLSQVSNLAVIGIIYANIPTVGGWSVWEILLLYGYLLFSEGWVNFFFQGSWKIAQMVNKSEIDRFLVRPLPAGMQMAASRIDFDGLNKMIIALGILSVGIKNCKINWTIIKNSVFCGISAYSIYDSFLHDLDGKLQVLLDAGTKEFIKLSGSFCRRNGEISTYYIPRPAERNLWIHHTLRICQLLSRRFFAWEK